MKRNCFNCKHYSIEEYYNDEQEHEDYVFICDINSKSSEYIQFPYEKEMDCFE